MTPTQDSSVRQASRMSHARCAHGTPHPVGAATPIGSERRLGRSDGETAGFNRVAGREGFPRHTVKIRCTTR